MTIATIPWDPTGTLTSREAETAYLEAAFENSDRALIAEAVGDIARAEIKKRTTAKYSQICGSRLSSAIRIPTQIGWGGKWDDTSLTSVRAFLYHFKLCDSFGISIEIIFVKSWTCKLTRSNPIFTILKFLHYPSHWNIDVHDSKKRFWVKNGLVAIIQNTKHVLTNLAYTINFKWS